MFYGHNTDYANTRFCYNLVHDNRAAHYAMGIYFDHLSHNVIVHHNVIWNVGMDPVRINNPSYGDLVFNNTCWKTGPTKTFDHSKRDDLFASRFWNNIFNKPVELPEHVFQKNNLVEQSPPFRDPASLDFRLTGDDPGNPGAMPSDAPPWKAGWNPENPPAPLPVYQPADVPWMNGVRNACFEYGTLESWQVTDGGKATLIRGNNWGNSIGDGANGRFHATGTSKFELQLDSDNSGVSQVVENLLPGVTYELAAWLKVSGTDPSVSLGIADHGGEEITIACTDTEWTRKTLRFTTGIKSNSARIVIAKSPGKGQAWADNLTLPLRPKENASTVGEGR